MITIVLASVVDWPGFSRAIRWLRDRAIRSEQVRWRVEGDLEDDLFAGPLSSLSPLFPADHAGHAGHARPGRPEGSAASTPVDDDALREAHALPEGSPMRLPRAFVEAAREVFLHADDARLPLLHRLASRIADDARAWADPLHADRLQFDRLLREVRREIHKMHAFVRFRQIEGPVDGTSTDLGDGAFDDAFARSLDGAFDAVDAAAGASPVRHVAWFEPAHHVLEAAAPFFARRFSTMRWAILTPRVSVAWDGQALAFGPGAQRADAPAPDAGEALWLAYYRSIFNPARVKVSMMKKEMPVRFWKNLPEAAAIGGLLAEAPHRQQRMIAAHDAERERRRGRAGQGAASGAGASMTMSSPTADRSLDALRRQAARCRDCPVADVATQTVFGEGPADAALMLVGEQPGDHEDLGGRPFQGPAGTLLRAAFKELGWDATRLYLTNAVKHFHHELRGKRRLHKTPGQQEAQACLHWLEAEIAALRPAAIVALGAVAARSLLGREVGLLAHEGQWLRRADGVPVLICRHPAAILRADASLQAPMRARWIESLRAASSLALARGAEDAESLEAVLAG